MRLEKLLQYTEKPPQGAIVVLPFANQEVIDWLGKGYIQIAYTEQPRSREIFKRDCFTNPPKFQGAYTICFPPWTKKNDSADKTVFDLYGTDNLYKCFLKTIIKEQPVGGTIVIPFKFLTGTRESEQKRKQEFFRLFKPVNITVFKDVIINEEIPLVMQFIRRTDAIHKKEVWSVKLVEENKTTDLLWTADLFSKDITFINQANPFLDNYVSRPSKKVKASICPIDEQFSTFYLIKTENIHLTTEKTDLALKINIRGFLSQKLKERIIIDFNNWLNTWTNKTAFLFLQFIIINGKPVHYISSDLAIDALERIIWSYYLKN